MKNRNRTNYASKFKDNYETEYLVDETNEENDEEITEPEIVEETQFAAEEEVDECPVDNKYGIVDISKNQTLNLRENPNTEAEIVKTLKSGEQVVINDTYSDWYHVTSESGAEGYVVSKYITMAY